MLDYPGVNGGEEYEFRCPMCGEHEIVFTGNRFEAEGVCPDCEEVSLSPDEIYRDMAAESSFEMDRDR